MEKVRCKVCAWLAAAESSGPAGDQSTVWLSPQPVKPVQSQSNQHSPQSHLDDHLRVEAVERRVRAVRQGPDWVRELALLGDEGADLLGEGGVAAVLEAVAVDVPVVVGRV